MTFDSYTIHRFLIYSRIMEPLSKYAVPGRLNPYYEKPDFGYQHILRFMIRQKRFMLCHKKDARSKTVSGS